MRKQMEEDRKNAATAVGLSLGGMGPSMTGSKAGGILCWESMGKRIVTSQAGHNKKCEKTVR